MSPSGCWCSRRRSSTPDGNVINIVKPPPGVASQQKTYLRLVNGQLNPTMTIRPGETQRWRILNATANVTYLLQLDGHQLHQISKTATR